MRTILIAHRDETFSEQLSANLRAGGYRIINCPGPWPPVDVPMLLAWSPRSTPDTKIVSAVRAKVPSVRVAGHEPAILLRQIRALLSAPRQLIQVIT